MKEETFMICENEIHPDLPCPSVTPEGCEVPIGEAVYPAPFKNGLQYAPPARGTWTIAHSPMLIPGCHEIYVCCSCCLQGVVLSALEIPEGGRSRFSMVTVGEEHVVKGNLEEMMIEGVTSILNELPERPSLVECFTSCIQHFLHIDLKMVYGTLRKRFPDIDFVDGYMIPTLQRRFSPDELGRRQLVRALRKGEQEKAVNLIVNYYPTDPDSEICRLIRENGYRVRDFAAAADYGEYRAMGNSEINVYFLPNSAPAAEDLKRRLGQKAFYAPYSWDYEEITETLAAFSELLGNPSEGSGWEHEKRMCDEALDHLAKLLDGTETAIDYTATPRPLGLARLLLSHGIRVTRVYLDAVSTGEEKAFIWLKEHHPDLILSSAQHFKLPLLTCAAGRSHAFLAIGQKAAYFTGTDRFVNMIENGAGEEMKELWGFSGILKLAELMEEAFRTPKDVAAIIQTKAWGCRGGLADSCITGSCSADHPAGACTMASKDAQRVLSTYAADLFGMSSALFELGGLVVMHDASGCNSTYSTHDEPRWYGSPSMVYISGVREIDTIYGNDRRLIDNMIECARETKPAFIAVGGSPLPYVAGTDFRAVAKILEHETGIPSIGIPSDGIHSYIRGAGTAFRLLAEKVLPDKTLTAGSHLDEAGPGRKIRVNLLGVTPLDFSVTGNVTAMKDLLQKAGIELISCWAMGSSLDEIRRSAEADLNLVVSSAGLFAAEYMKETYGIPFLSDLPVGKSGAKRWIGAIRNSGRTDTGGGNGTAGRMEPDGHNRVLLIGEPVLMQGIAACLKEEFDLPDVRIVCPIRDIPDRFRDAVDIITSECELREAVLSADIVVADPIYSRLCEGAVSAPKFIRLPHEAYSGRYYRAEMPVFIGDGFTEWFRSAVTQ